MNFKLLHETPGRIIAWPVKCQNMNKLQDANNADELKMLYMLFADRVRQAAYFVVRDHSIADDVMQETFLIAMEKLSQLKDSEKVEAWLVRIAINKARDFFRHRNRLVPAAMPVADDAGDGQVEDLVLKKQEVDALHAAILDLPEDFQLLLYFKYKNEWSVKRIASTLGIAEGTVKSRLYRVREVLKKALNESYLEKEEAWDDQAQR
ncbi:MAG: RNA polymerase sigma factor [Spirochaetota bacterium]